MVEQGTKPAIKTKGNRKQENSLVEQISKIISQSEAKANEKIDTSILQKVDFSAVEEFDPQKQQQFTEVFTKVVKVSLELDTESLDNYMKTVANLNLRVLVNGLEVEPVSVRVLLTCEDDVQLYY